MKKIIFLIILSTIIFCGCEFATDYENAVIFFSSKPIIIESFKPNMIENDFETGQPIYVCIYSKNPFNINEALIQIFKKNLNTKTYGYCLFQTKEILLNPTKNYYTDSFTIYTEGCYLINVSNPNNPDEILAKNTLYISQ